MSQLTTRDYKGAAPRPRGAGGGLSQFLWGTLAGALLAGLGAALIVHHASQAARVCAGTGIAATPAAPAGRGQGAATPPGPVPAGAVPGASSGSGGRSPASASSSIRGSGGRQSGRSARDASPAPAPQDTLARGASQGPSVAAHSAAASTPQYDFYQMLPNLRVTVPPPSAPGARSVGPGGRRRFGGYVLQVGAYNSEAHARKVVAYLDSLGTLAHIDPMRDGAKTLYRVRIGPVIERWELDRFRHQLKLVGLPAMLVPGATH
ncbi:MAG: SPOR domain-containing protein [Steroidobacteraceae bacterium]